MYRKLKPRILSVDDDPSIGELMQRLFGQAGRFTVAVECDSFKAVDAARKFRPDIIILDVNMPGQTGTDIARRLRSEPWLRYRPIIIFTGLPTALCMKNLASHDGPIEYLAKGVPLNVIEETVDRLLACQN